MNLNQHLQEIIHWHFSDETGCPFWLDWKKNASWNPLEEIKTFDDLLKFDHFQDDWLRFEQPQRWIPRGYDGKPFSIFETGGTTGMPKQRISWDDIQTDYHNYAQTLDDKLFQSGKFWLSMGPTGPRRLRLSIECLAHARGCSCYFIDLDPRWVKKLIATKQFDQAQAYMDHVIDQTITILKHRQVDVLFSTPRLLESLGEKISLPDQGIKAIFCAGTEMSPQTVRFLIEEVLENQIAFIPIYGNTLMGLAQSLPVRAEDNYSITYYPPQPRAVIRVVDPQNTQKQVDYEKWGRVELTTLTKEFFMPRFLERDEAIRKPPCERFPFDGVADVRPFGSSENKVVEGVY
jgi:phenylacetate-coenzyme A ligase PaaK-like adenylate-forming protein